MDREKAWTLAAMYYLLLGAGFIVLCAMFWVEFVLSADVGILLVAVTLTAFLVPLGYGIFRTVPRSRPFPVLSTVLEPARRPPQYYPPPPGAYPYYFSQYTAQPPYAQQAQYTYPYVYPYAPAPPYTAPYQHPYGPGYGYGQVPGYPPAQPYAYPPQPYYGPPQPPGQQPNFPPVVPVAPQQGTYAPPAPGSDHGTTAAQAAYGHAAEPSRGVAVIPPAPTDRPVPPTTPSAPTPLPGAAPRSTWEPFQATPPPPPPPPPFAPAPSPGPDPSPPSTRSDGRPPLAIHDFDWYLALFLAATFIGGGLLALGPGASIATDLLMVACFVVSFSFPSLIWIAFVHHRRSSEPEPREGILLALGGGMLATVPPLFINTIAAVWSESVAIAVVAPIVEEFSKALVVVLIVQEVNSRYDGLIYGVTAGMGFAMMENLMYSVGALFGAPSALDAAASWGLMSLVRGLGSTVGHAVGVGLVGYAIAAYIDPRGRAPFSTVGLAYLGAVGLHAGWNGTLVLAEGLGGAAGTALDVAIILSWPLLEIFILVTLMRRGRATGDDFPGGGVYHIDRPSPIMATAPAYAPPVPQYAAPSTYWPPQPPPY